MKKNQLARHWLHGRFRDRKRAEAVSSAIGVLRDSNEDDTHELIREFERVAKQFLHEAGRPQLNRQQLGLVHVVPDGPKFTIPLIDLFFEMILSSFKPLEDLRQRFGVDRILAAIIVREAEWNRTDEALRASRFLESRRRTVFFRKGPQALQEKLKAAKTFALDVAGKSWAEDPNQQKAKVAEYIISVISATEVTQLGLSKRPTLTQVVRWIGEVAPPEASRPGRPRKT